MSEGETEARLRVVPNASRSEVIGWMADGCLKVKVQAPPEGGRANKEVCAVVAGALGVPRRAVTLLSGEKNRLKTLSVDGVTEEVLKKRFSGNKEGGGALA